MGLPGRPGVARRPGAAWWRGDRRADATPILARFSTQGRFIADLSITEEELLREAIAAEQEQEAETTFTADGAYTADGYCPICGFHIRDYGCQCGT